MTKNKLNILILIANFTKKINNKMLYNSFIFIIGTWRGRAVAVRL